VNRIHYRGRNMHNLKFSRVNTQIFVDSVEARVVATEAVVAGLPKLHRILSKKVTARLTSC
jgi:hypothetical protein